MRRRIQLGILGLLIACGCAPAAIVTPTDLSFTNLYAFATNSAVSNLIVLGNFTNSTGNARFEGGTTYFVDGIEVQEGWGAFLTGLYTSNYLTGSNIVADWSGGFFGNGAGITNVNVTTNLSALPDLTNEIARVAGETTNEVGRVAAQTTNEVGRVAAQTTNHVTLLSTAATNEVGRVAAETTNEVARVAAETTNHVTLLSTAATNEVGRVAAETTNEVGRVSALLTNHVTLSTNWAAITATNIAAYKASLVTNSGLTTNINVMAPGGTTNQLQFSQGILTGVVPTY